MSLPGNFRILDRYWEFRATLKNAKAETLKSPNGYYPYGTLDIIPRILPILDRYKIDLEWYLKSRTILDLGCGDGDLSFFFELFGPQRIIAVDWGPTNFNTMEACWTLKKALGSKVDFMDVDIHSFNFRDFPRFETVFCFGFLYHSPHPLLILKNLAEKGKTLFLTTKMFDNDKPYLYFYDIGECNNDPTNWYCFTQKALSLMLVRSGFDVKLIERLDSNIGMSDPVNTELDGRAFVHATSAIISAC